MTTSPSDQPIAPERDEAALVDALRRGDEAAFVRLVELHHRPLIRMAMLYVRDRDVAEEVVQEAWIAVVRGVDRFEGRSSLRTWISRIVTYQAKTRGERERRNVPLSRLLDPADEAGRPAVDADRFRDREPWEGHWADPPQSWGSDAERRLLARETQGVIATTLERLPGSQRTVITLRDIEGWSSDEVCEALEISAGNQRVLLHRARSRVRGALEEYFREERTA